MLHFHYLFRRSYSGIQQFTAEKITSICIYNHQFPNVICELRKFKVDELFRQSSRFKDLLVGGSVLHSPTSSLVINLGSCMRFDHFREGSRMTRKALGTRKGKVRFLAVSSICFVEVLNRAKNLQEDSFLDVGRFTPVQHEKLQSFSIISYDDSFNSDEIFSRVLDESQNIFFFS